MLAGRVWPDDTKLGRLSPAGSGETTPHLGRSDGAKTHLAQKHFCGRGRTSWMCIRLDVLPAVLTSTTMAYRPPVIP